MAWSLPWPSVRLCARRLVVVGSVPVVWLSGGVDVVDDDDLLASSLSLSGSWPCLGHVCHCRLHGHCHNLTNLLLLQWLHHVLWSRVDCEKAVLWLLTCVPHAGQPRSIRHGSCLGSLLVLELDCEVVAVVVG